jgi:hypothetical protein
MIEGGIEGERVRKEEWKEGGYYLHFPISPFLL